MYAFIGMDINISPTYPKNLCPNFFLEKVWLKNTLPTYSLDICPNFRSFFIWDLSLRNLQSTTLTLLVAMNSMLSSSVFVNGSAFLSALSRYTWLMVSWTIIFSTTGHLYWLGTVGKIPWWEPCHWSPSALCQNMGLVDILRLQRQSVFFLTMWFTGSSICFSGSGFSSSQPSQSCIKYTVWHFWFPPSGLL